MARISVWIICIVRNYSRTLKPKCSIQCLGHVTNFGIKSASSFQQTLTFPSVLNEAILGRSNYVTFGIKADVTSVGALCGNDDLGLPQQRRLLLLKFLDIEQDYKYLYQTYSQHPKVFSLFSTEIFHFSLVP